MNKTINIEKSLDFDIVLTQMSSFCAFSLGKEYLLNVKPSFNKLIIKRDNLRMKEALDLTIRFNEMPFNGFKDIKECLNNVLKDRMITSNDCLNVISHFSGIKDINNYFSDYEEEYKNLNELVSSLFYNQKLVDYLNNIFNEYGEIKDSASNTLKSIRESLRKVESEILFTSEKFKKENVNKMVDGIITNRSNRIVALVKASDKNSFGGFVHGESASGQAFYVEPAIFVELNNKKINLIYKEEEEIEKILFECGKEIKQYAEYLLYNLETVAILDSFFARAKWGKINNCTVAKLVDDKKIILNKARHPLIDKDKVVSNNYKISSPHRVLLVSGPNTGGKTISLKIIGLMVLMTYSGMPISVDNAEIPFFDNVFVDIGDEQSVVESLSTFSAHLSKLAIICNNATDRSLVLLDELGSGTDPKEGESLAIAILNELRERKCLLVATTHYGKLKSYGKKHEDILVAMVQFDLEKLTPTYKFIEGITGQSNAFEIALRYGLNEKIIKNAKFLKEQGKSNEDKLIEKLEEQLLQNKILNEKLTLELSNLEKSKNELSILKNEIEISKNKIIEDAKDKAKIYLEQKTEEAQLILEELRLMQNKNFKYHEALKLKKMIEIQDEDIDEKTEDNNFKVNDTVVIKSSNQLAKIISIKKNQVVLDVRGINVVSKINNIKKTNQVINDKKPKSTVVNSFKVTETKFECNLIGKTVEEAMSVFEKFIDNAKFSKMPMVRIIHGDGSGALRKAVHLKLSKDNSVKEYRLGMPNEGGTGATVVTFKV